MPEFFGTGIRTILMLDADRSGRLAGFASWSPVRILDSNGMEQAELIAFGIASGYQRLVTDDGDLVADRLFETVLDDIDQTLDTDRPPITLNCHKDNRRARRFWCRHDFAIVPDGDSGPNYVEMAFESAEADSPSGEAK